MAGWALGTRHSPISSHRRPLDERLRFYPSLHIFSTGLRIVFFLAICFPSVGAPALFEQDAFNPVLYSEADIEAFRAHCERLLQRSRDARLGARHPGNWGFDERCAALFLQFTENAERDRTSMVNANLRVRIDAEVPRVRDEAVLDCVQSAWDDAARGFSVQTGLSIPEGQIYVWILPDIQELIDKWHLEHGVGAATFMSRYVAVPLSPYKVYAPGRVLPFTGLSFRRLETDLRHEFTHALFLGLTGREGLGIPSWFLEGMAVTVAKNVPTEVTRDYAQFGRAFRRCRKVAGEEKFEVFCADLAEGGDFDELLLETTGYVSYESIVREFQSRDRMKWVVFLSIVAGFFLRGVFRRTTAQPRETRKAKEGRDEKDLFENAPFDRG